MKACDVKKIPKRSKLLLTFTFFYNENYFLDDIKLYFLCEMMLFLA